MEPATPEEVRRINQGGQSGQLQPYGIQARVGQLVTFRRRYVVHDADGKEIGFATDVVKTLDNDGELTPQRLTILDVENVDVFATEVSKEDLGILTIPIAKACGHRTIQGLRDSWRQRHPRSPLAKLVWFAVGDVRDLPLFLAFSGTGSDYTANRSRALDDAEALTREQMMALASWNQQKDQGRRAHTAMRLAAQLLSQRMAALEAIIEQSPEAYKLVRQELRISEQRVRRAEGRQQVRD